MNSSSSGQVEMGQAEKPDPLSIFLLSRSLEPGGAEKQLVELAIGMRERGHLVRVGVFYEVGALAKALHSAGIEIIDLQKRGRWDIVQFLARTIRVLRRIEPDVVYSFLGGANIVAAAAKLLAPRTRLVWSIRNSEFDMSVDHWVAHAGFRLEAELARVPAAIIANSGAGRDFAVQRGFPDERIIVVPNGIDTARFRHDEEIRLDQRRKLDLAPDDVAVGVLARLNATKGYPIFLRAAALVAQAIPNARFLCVGSGEERPALQTLADELGIEDRVTFTGELDPIAALNAFDIACSPSITEGFSNSIAEAMSCGLPCVVSDVGDSAALVGDTGIVVPAGSPDALADAIQRQIARLGTHDPQVPRSRIVDNFGVDAMVDRTLEVFQSVVRKSLG